jgi:hypothetical protein
MPQAGLKMVTSCKLFFLRKTNKQACHKQAGQKNGDVIKTIFLPPYECHLGHTDDVIYMSAGSPTIHVASDSL